MSGHSSVENFFISHIHILPAVVFNTRSIEIFYTVKPENLRNKVDVRGSVHYGTIHKEKSNKMQQCIKILLFHIYIKLNMFRATHRPSSGA
jgi:hypothetical protein